MTKKKAKAELQLTGEPPAMDEADGVRSSEATQRGEPAGDFMEVGKEVVPGMRLRAICRGSQGTIGRIAWSPCGRCIASPSTDKTIRICPRQRRITPKALHIVAQGKRNGEAVKRHPGYVIPFVPQP